MRRLRRGHGPGDPGPLVLVVVLIAAAAAIAYKVAVTVGTGPGWDTYAFLANAAEFVGKGYGYTELHRPPFLSLLATLAFRLGAPMHEAVIQWADGVLTLSGIAAFYLVARRRFRPLLSGVGALMLLGIQPLWGYLGSGYTDFPSVALSLWLLWSCIKATEEHPGWYLLAGPLFVAATLTRYTAVLAVFPVLVWVVLRWRPFHQAGAIAGGLVTALAAYWPAARFYAARFGDVLFPFVLAFGVSESISSPTGEGSVDASAMWYVTRLPTFLAGERLALAGWVVLVVTALGTALGAIAYLQSHRPRAARALWAVLACVPAVATQFAGGMVLRQISIPIAVLGVWYALGPAEHDERGHRIVAPVALHATMIAWLLTYLDFHGHQSVQVPRYIVPMAPGIVFAILYGWQTFVVDVRRTLTREDDLPEHRSMRPFLRLAAPVGLGIIVAAVLGVTIATTNHEPDRLVVAAKDSAAWLEQREDIGGATVFSDLWPLTAWYARIPAEPMPFFSDDAAFQHALDREATDYYVTIRSRDYEGYATAVRTGPARVLERTAPAPDTLPRLLYLGKAWDNYLESVTDYSFYLMSDAGRYGWEGTAFLDSTSAEDLAAFPVVAVYGVRWRDRYDGEAALAEYVRAGGVMVVDASSNLGELPYDLADTVLFDTVIRRRGLPEDAAIHVSEELRALDPRLADVDAAPFVDESGGTWHGADYTPLPGSEDLTVLATVGGRPAVALRTLGEGRVYLIGYNLVWHAFFTENADEQALIGAVFAHALAPAGDGTADAP